MSRFPQMARRGKALLDWMRRPRRPAGSYACALFGPYGAGNIGDDAILESLLSRHFDVGRQRLSIITEDPAATRRHVSGANLVARADRAAWTRALRESGGVLLAGGTMISDSQGMEFPFGYSKPILEILLRYGVPHAMMGIGINSVTTPEGRDFFRHWYGRAKVFAVRDEHCANVLLDLGVRQEDIVVAADPVFAWRPPERLAPEMLPLREEMRSRPFSMAVNVTHEEWKDRGALYSEVARCCDRLARETGAGIVFFASDCRPGDRYDAAAIAVTVRQMREKCFVLPCANYRPAELASFLGGFSLVLSMRMHPLILGALGSAIPVGIIRQPKMQRVLDEVCGGPQIRAETAAAEEMYELCRERLSNLPSLKLEMKKNMAALSDRELNNRLALKAVGLPAPEDVART